MSDTDTVFLLPKGAGYGVLLGVGAVFAIGMILTTKFLQKYLNENATSTETFSVADRSVKRFLACSSVYASWSWADEILQTVSMIYNYGVQASFYYGAGLSVQMCVMALIGISAKKRAPQAHTSLEIVGLRYGKATHILFLFLCLVTNLISCSSMLLSASGAISIISGNLSIVASTLLIPFGVLLYTTFGGLKATFLTDYVHSFVLLLILIVINTKVLASKEIGGLNGLYSQLLEHSQDRYIEGNYQGSILTGKSQGSIIFGLVLTCGNFGLTVMDSSFWQKSFSAEVKATVPSYLGSAVLIFANTWPIGAIIGGASIILQGHPSFPTFPRKMTQFEIDSGFVLPYTVKAVLGNSGVGAVLLTVYLAVTSTSSAQMISVSSILSFDIYKKYINPQANNKQMIRVAHFGVVFFGLFAAGFTLMLHYVNVNMTWMGYFMSIVICPGVFPLIFTVTWDRQTTIAAFVAPITGLVFGFAVWITTTNKLYGEITIDTLGMQIPCLYASLTALFLPAVVSIILSLTVFPKKFDWKELSEAKLLIKATGSESESESESEGEKSAIKEKSTIENVQVFTVEEDLGVRAADPAELNFYSKVAKIGVVVGLLLTWVLWPLPLYRDWIWSAAYYKGYVVVGLIWLYVAFIIIGLAPIWEGRHAIKTVSNGIYRDYIKRSK
ncbi:urea transport protein [Scheffersomyces stipitis CBS 6054]|uniref:Urea transport protein n=1 Tax=Scheffersomyces stipitis (strain ATCC 58785 / CBS 6054 / NBRC 10063 / NRRL Y-11545) TaxID=322104 RepID=A3LRQ0_PICST|nr:urea transport protein [Scheffersomyces stipitis CBS 6054]ABN65775.2 urea transport protein [Scheffersomyces stipitis CBS 6054]KAG2734028.1 hypothetical protein G9P44_003553 [Scheffersomyces stipitis]